MPRTRKFTHGTYGRELVPPLPQALSRRRATSKPDGRRQASWVFRRHAALHQLGDVTMVLSKKRRNCGPKRVKIIVTNLRDASASASLSPYAVRGGVELTSKERKGGLHLGRIHVSQEADRGERSVVLPVWAYLWLVRVYGNAEGARKGWRLLQCKQRFTEELLQDQGHRMEQKWLRKCHTSKQVA